VARTENAGMSEDEALAAAMAASMSEVGRREEEGEEQDRLLALALQESERQAARRRGQTAGGDEGDKSCSLQ